MIYIPAPAYNDAVKFYISFPDGTFRELLPREIQAQYGVDTIPTINGEFLIGRKYNNDSESDDDWKIPDINRTLDEFLNQFKVMPNEGDNQA